MCVTDLDGTLLNQNHEISLPNQQALMRLGEQNICRVAATGRSLYSLHKVLPPEAYFDYVIFTTGAGLMDWHTQQILLSKDIDPDDALYTFEKLIAAKADFMYHAPIPENHWFVYVKGRGLPDFFRRIELYKDFAIPFDENKTMPWSGGTQFLIIAEETELELHDLYINLLSPLKVVRTTSPLDHKSLWLEVFSPGVSKGSAAEYIAEKLHINLRDIVVVGNDYNDSEMLDLTPHAYITANAPEELKSKYKVVADHNENGFAEAIKDWLSANMHY